MIRIISGTLKGRKLFTLPGIETRPTSDRLRESIFNILSRFPTPETVVDLFAGTGAMGIEAISRGADYAYFVDGSPAAIALIKKNISVCGLEQQAKVLKWDISKNLNCLNTLPGPVDRVFLDPPYDKGHICSTLNLLAQSPVITPDTLIVAEHVATEPIIWETLPFEPVDERSYRHTMVSFLRKMA